MLRILLFLLALPAYSQISCFPSCGGGGGGSGSVNSVSAGTLVPIFTTSVSSPTTNPVINFSLSTAAQNSVFGGPASGGTGAPSFQTAPTFSAANLTSLPITLTTTGSSGAATWTQGTNTLNIPQYSGGGVTSFSAGNLSPLFTSSVATATTTPALSFALSSFAADSILGNFTAGSAAPSTQAIPACAADGSHALTYASHTLGCTAVSGGGSGNTTSTSLTTNTIPKASGANSIVNSSLTDDGTTVSTTESISAASFIGGTTFKASGGESATPTAPSADTLFFSSTNHVPQFTILGNSTIDATMAVPASGATSHQWVDYIPTTGIPHTSQPAASDISGLNATAVGLGSVTNDAQTKAAVMPNTAPSAGQIPAGNAGGTAYAPVSVSGDATLASTGAFTVKGVNGVPLCTGFTPTNGQALEYTTASSPNPCYTAATPGGSSSNPDDPSYYLLRDDFSHGAQSSPGVGDVGWTVTGIGGATAGSNTSGLAGVANHFGITSLSSTTTNPSGILLYMNPGTFAYNLTIGIGALTGWRQTCIFKMAQSSNTAIYCGLQDNGTSPPSTTNASNMANAIAIRFDTGLTAPDSGTFKFVTCVSSACSVANSSISADTNWHKAIISAAASGTISFSIDGETAVTTSTDVPGSTVTMAPFIGCLGRGTSSGNQCYIDYYSLYVPATR